MIKIDIFKKIGGRYGTVDLRVNTTFQSGTVTQISGPSGIGKTTLLKILAGLVLPDSGMVTSDDEIWFDKAKNISKKVQDRNVGFVFQDYALFPNMTVEEHLRYATNNQEYVNYLLELGEMMVLSKRYPKQLSGGQQQRVAILRALATKPKLLLMDEPFTALDAELKLRLIKGLSSLFLAQKTTVVLVSHQNDEFAHQNRNVFLLSND
ncbi:MAG: ATP-binding cassette domain-containing protein [Sphingobacteriales bacterium]|nr:MAG: ATP-binding cassette domain-containing protein [Sphingobacteriales bacterium]